MEFIMPSQDEYTFVVRKRMPSGMTAQVTFYGDYWDNQRTAEFSVWFVVFKKRKTIPSLVLESTGRDGLKTLLFAKKAILDFEKFIHDRYGSCHQKIFINIGWDDNRRRDIYFRGLKNEGYRFKQFNGNKFLSKQII